MEEMEFKAFAIALVLAIGLLIYFSTLSRRLESAQKKQEKVKDLLFQFFSPPDKTP